MQLLSFLKKTCEHCRRDFLRGHDSCGKCNRGFTGFSLNSKQPQAHSIVRFLEATFEMPAEDNQREERSLMATLSDWRDPLVLRIVILVVLTVLVLN